MSDAPKIIRTSFAAHPVWTGSTARAVRFAPLSKRAAVRLYHDARRFEGQTRAPGQQDGAIGRNGLAILQAMLFDCINFVSGELYPSYATLARLANISIRSVGRGLAKLKAAGVVNWLRRCYWNTDTGQLAQDTNAYAVRPDTQWHGFKRPAPAPAPERGAAWLAARQIELGLDDPAIRPLSDFKDTLARIRAREMARDHVRKPGSGR